MSRKTQSIGEIFDEWLFLREPIYFFSHASELLGKKAVYNEFVANAAKYFTIHEYMQSYVNTQRKKLKNVMTNRLTQICKILKESNDATKALNESFAQAAALIPLLLSYFNDGNAIYKLLR